MSSLYRPRVITYRFADGSFRTPEGIRVTKQTPGAVKVDEGKSELWYGKYTDGSGKSHRVRLCNDKTASKQMLAKLVTEAALVEHGIADPVRQGQHKRPLTEHLADYRRHLEAKGCCAEHVVKTCSKIQAVFAGCGFVLLANVDAGRLEEFLHGLRRDPRRPALPPGLEAFTLKELVQALGGSKPARLGRVLKRENLAVTGSGKARRYPRTTVEVLQERFCRGLVPAQATPT